MGGLTTSGLETIKECRTFDPIWNGEEIVEYQEIRAEMETSITRSRGASHCGTAAAHARLPFTPRCRTAAIDKGKATRLLYIRQLPADRRSVLNFYPDFAFM